MSPSALDLYRLALVGRAAQAAKEIAEQHPDAVFTSGRRDREEQASAMAANVVLDSRQWIAQTYKPSEASIACQQWVDAHPEATTKEAVAAGLLSMLERFTDEQLSKLSKHLGGCAFDIQPAFGLSGQLLLNTIRRVVAKHGGTFLEREGGLTRWHCQF
jgi:hypothetical protein